MVTLALGVSLTIISAFGLLLNGYILIVIFLTKVQPTAGSVLILHLGVTGALASGAALGGAAGVGADSMCGYALTLLHPVQLWTVCGLHADRCVAIAAPLHYAALVSPKKALIGLASGWLMGLIIITPSMFENPPLTCAEGSACTPNCGDGPMALLYCAVYITVTLLLPAALIVLCNLKILSIARRHRHRIAAAIFEVTLSAQVAVTHQRNPFTPPLPPPRRRSALAAVLQLLGSLALLYLPHYGVLIWRAAATPPPVLAAAAAALLAAAPPVNGLLYGVRSRALRRSLRNYWRKKLTKSEITQEIQARTPSACGSRRPSLAPSGQSPRAAPVRRLSDAGYPRPRADTFAPRAASCNALRSACPETEESAMCLEMQAEMNSQTRNPAIPTLRADAHTLLARALGLEEKRSRKRRGRSPRITVTRAASDESERGSPAHATSLSHQRSHSSAALLQRAEESECEETAEPACPEERLLLSWPGYIRPADSVC